MLNKIRYIFTKKQKIQLLGLSIMNIFAAVFELLGVSAVLPLITVVLTPEVIETNSNYRLISDIFKIEDARSFILFMSLVLIVLYFVKNIYLMTNFYIFLKFNYAAIKSVSMRLMTCYMNQDYLFHVKNSVSKLQRNVNNDVRSFFSVVTGYINLFIEGLTCILLLAYLLYVDVFTTIAIALTLAIIGGIIMKLYKNKQVKAGAIVRKTSAEQNKWFLQAFGGIKEIKVLNREDFFLNHYSEATDRNIETNIKINVLTRFPKYIIEIIMITAVLGVISLRIMMGVNLTSFATTLSAFVVAAIRLIPSFNRITEYASSVFQGKVAVENIYKDLKEIEGLSDNNKNNSSESMKFENQIDIKNISFKYPGTNKWIIKDGSLSLKKNNSIAFIGESGAGKTTLVDIILGLLSPNVGSIDVDGVDISSDLNSWHKTIGYIPQSIYLMDDTIKNNIIFGMNEKVDEQRLKNAIEMACLSKFIDELEDGVETQIGDRGVRLSGGQRQRIGIARALYADPKVLVLDEATSALDNETEKSVMEAIDNLHGKMTLIIIAHRLSTIKNCDSIYKVEKGTISLKDKSEIFKNTDIK